MKTYLKISLLIVTFQLTACGVAIYEDSSDLKKYSGKLTVVNESYREDVRVEVSLGETDQGYIPSMYISPTSKQTRRFTFHTRDCDPYA